ncbi:MAG: hypothetical protein IKG27_05815 [Bacilli bacterium]|nr:hypothetical protein [Bacilli bacterium]
MEENSIIQKPTVGIMEAMPNRAISTKQEIISEAKRMANELLINYRKAETIYEVFVQNQNGADKLEVKRYKDTNGEIKYIYAAYDGSGGFGSKIIYYAESSELLPAFNSYTPDSPEKPFISVANKNLTAYNGESLIGYPGARSYIRRNLTGIFKDYLVDGQYNDFGIAFQTAPDSEIQVRPKDARCSDMDPVFLIQADLKRSTVGETLRGYIERRDGKKFLNLAAAPVKADGTVDIDRVLENMRKQNEAIGLIDGHNLTDEQLKEMLAKQIMLVQDVLPKIIAQGALTFGDVQNDLLNEEPIYELPDETGPERKPR